MRLTLTQQTREEEREAIWLRAVEAGDTTVEDLSRVTGLSVRRIQERLKRARENREIEPDGTDERDDDGLPYVAITSDPERELGEWYEPESGACSVDSGRVRIGDHSGRRLLVRSVNGGAPVDPGLRRDHKPDPDGLKGGVG